MTKAKVLQLGILLTILGLLSYKLTPLLGLNDIKVSAISNSVLIIIVFGWVLESKWLPTWSTGPPEIETFWCEKPVWAPSPPPDLDFDGFGMQFGCVLGVV